ncbi:MAG: peptidylprolyl isomerase, partial [Candidatus Nanopelagicaceae bacterium]
LRKAHTVKRGIYFGLVVLLVGSLSACSATPKENVATPSASPSASATAPSTGATTLASGVVCEDTSAIGHSPITVTPPGTMTKGRMGTFTLVTNCGNIVIETNGVKAPVTMTALTALATGGYFNASLCHRLTTAGIFVLQCGDPTATGSGGPGFTYQDENLPQPVANNYPEGTVAMANSGPSTNGSQFFLVYEDTSLGASYTIWGKITSGLNIVKAIAAAGVVGGGSDGTPVAKIAIEKVIVK